LCASARIVAGLQELCPLVRVFELHSAQDLDEFAAGFEADEAFRMPESGAPLCIKEDMAAWRSARFTKAAMKELKDILLESANYFWNRAQWLSNHARKSMRLWMKLESSSCWRTNVPSKPRRISTCARVNQLKTLWWCPTLARLPSPPASAEEWAAEVSPDRWKQNGLH
jgi:hypothetical protein